MKLFSLVLLLLAGLLQIAGTAATPAAKAVPKTSARKVAARKAPASKKSAVSKTTAAKTSVAVKAPAKTRAKAAPARKSARRAPRRRIKAAPPVDPTEGDNVDGEELTVRRAAVAAMGTLNGAVVVVDPSNGRVLSIVNQKLALRSGFVPCSTIKLVTALAALSEGVIDRETTVRLSRRSQFDLTSALAKSNNPFFEKLGNQLGYDRVTYYARMLGLGEKAGLNIPGEEPGVWPAAPPRGGSVGKMTAYGQDILMTPLELAALVSAIANGGDLYYLQYPRSNDELQAFEPQLKRRLELTPARLEDVKVGMRAAVEVGTARRADYEPGEPIMGKTGTCTDFRVSSHMGWFGSFIEVDHHPLVVVVMLLGTKTVNGPVASGIAGAIYRNLSEQRYFVADAKPGELLSTGSCCTR